MKTDKIQRLFDDACAKGMLTGIVMAAGSSRGQDFIQALGTMSPEDDRPMPIDAIFDIASITKPIATASACAMAVERGWLDVEAPASRYLPDLQMLPGKPVNSVALATHYSGYDNEKTHHLCREDARKVLLAKPPKYVPFEHFEYSCRNFILLGWIFEQCSGRELGEFCEEEIFSALQMKNTRFGPLTDPVSLRVVATWVAPGIISDEQARFLGRPVGNAGLFTDVEDLGVFCRYMLSACRSGDHTVFGEEATRLLTTPASPADMPRRSFGWDMRSRELAGHRPANFSASSFGHSGWTGQSIWMDPEADRYVIILTNRTTIKNETDTHAAQMVFRGHLSDLILE